MAKLDVYLRSIKQLGARGAVLTSGQAVTLRFPTGDRHATQITSHDQLIALVREIAPPAALEAVDKNRPAKFEIEGNGARWTIQVSPKPGAWLVAIDPAEAAPPPPGARTDRPLTAPPAPETTELPIERGQYFATAGGGSGMFVPPSSGSQLLDQLTAGARAAYASDVYLSAGSPAFQRVGKDLAASADRTRIDGDTLSRELGLVAPAEARGAWTGHGQAVFAYGDGAGRVRVTLTRDHRGPGATLRLLPAEAPQLAALGAGGLPGVADWLTDRGLILVAGPSGSGRTTTLAALVRALGELRRRVVSIEDPIEIVHVSPWISQRAVGDHVPSVGDGVAAAMREGADAIVIGGVHTAADAAAVVEAVAGGHLVLTTLVAPRAGLALNRLIGYLSVDQRELARALCADTLLGTIGPVVSRSGRSYEVVARTPQG
ncbi:MAG TPA: ATPase, T2SS/T4P/T4SS family [Kofleriaceae bacterium]|nr:ATPase, T2SS/T4P/T4SS family [Kofleriaceae bacterium]